MAEDFSLQYSNDYQEFHLVINARQAAGDRKAFETLQEHGQLNELYSKEITGDETPKELLKLARAMQDEVRQMVRKLREFEHYQKMIDHLKQL